MNVCILGTTTAGFQCSKQGFFHHEKNPWKFWYCKNEKKSLKLKKGLFTCPDGYIFNWEAEIFNKALRCVNPFRDFKK